MKPSQVASTLVRIATKLQNSKRPDRTLVAAELKLLVRKIADETPSLPPGMQEFKNGNRCLLITPIEGEGYQVILDGHESIISDGSVFKILADFTGLPLLEARRMIYPPRY